MDEALVENRSYLKAVAKAFNLLEALAGLEHDVRLTDLSKGLHIPKATTFRILFTLEQLGYVERTSGVGAYRIRNKSGWFPRNRSRETLRSICRPYMEKLLVRFEQTVNLAVLELDRVLYLDVLEGLRLVRTIPAINSFGAIHTTALGKSILAALSPAEAQSLLQRHVPLEKNTERTLISVRALMTERIRTRKRGYALDNEETEVGARCVGAPVLGAGGEPVGAISISGPVNALAWKTIRQIGQALKQCTRAISPQLGYTPAKPRGWS